MSKHIQDIKDILIIHTWGLGDMILLTPVLNIIHKLHPDVRFSFIVFQKIAAYPIINASYTEKISFCSWKLLDLLKATIKHKQSTSDAVLFSSGVNSWKAGLYMLFFKTKLRIGEFRTNKFPFLTKYSFFQKELSRTESNYKLFKLFLPLPEWEESFKNRNEMNLKTSFCLDKTSRNYAEQFLTEHKITDSFIIGMHPGCLAKNRYRRWPKEYFVTLIGLLHDYLDCSIIIIAGPDELEEADYISRNTGSLLLSNEQLPNVAALVAKCDFFINTDSGLGHVASCFDIKTLTIFGPGDERQTAPFADNSHTVREQIACSPCVGQKTRNCNSECLRNLCPQDVFKKVKTILQGG